MKTSRLLCSSILVCGLSSFAGTSSSGLSGAIVCSKSAGSGVLLKVEAVNMRYIPEELDLKLSSLGVERWRIFEPIEALQLGISLNQEHNIVLHEDFGAELGSTDLVKATSRGFVSINVNEKLDQAKAKEILKKLSDTGALTVRSSQVANLEYPHLVEKDLTSKKFLNDSDKQVLLELMAQLKEQAELSEGELSYVRDAILMAIESGKQQMTAYGMQARLKLAGLRWFKESLDYSSMQHLLEENMLHQDASGFNTSLALEGFGVEMFFYKFRHIHIFPTQVNHINHFLGEASGKPVNHRGTTSLKDRLAVLLSWEIVKD